MSAEMIERLDRILTVLQLAFRDPIENARREIRQDEINVALLDATEDDWVGGGEVVRRVVVATKGSSRSISRRLASLVAVGAIDKRGGGAQTAYRSSGLI